MRKILFFIGASLLLMAPALAEEFVGPPAPKPDAKEVYYCHYPSKLPGGREYCTVAENGKDSCSDGVVGTTEPCKCGPGSSDPNAECIQLENPIPNGSTDPIHFISLAIQAVLGLVGAITLFMFFWGASGWILAAGNSEKISSGAQTMLYAAIGLIVVFSSYIILKIVFSALLPN